MYAENAFMQQAHNAATGTLKKKVFWLAQADAFWLGIPILIPLLYYEVYIPAIAFPEAFGNWLSQFFPVFSLFDTGFTEDEAQRYESSYILVLILGMVCLPLSILNRIKYETNHFLLCETVNGKELERAKQKIRRIRNVASLLFLTIATLLLPIFAFWVSFYNQIAPILFASMPLAGMQIFAGNILALYKKNNWLS